jgi:hypothetical protein
VIHYDFVDSVVFSFVTRHACCPPPPSTVLVSDEAAAVIFLSVAYLDKRRICWEFPVFSWFYAFLYISRRRLRAKPEECFGIVQIICAISNRKFQSMCPVAFVRNGSAAIRSVSQRGWNFC